MKYLVGILTVMVGFLAYNQYRITKFNIAVETQYAIDRAELEHVEKGARFDACQITRYLNKKMGYKAWTNCYYPDFGNEIDNMNPSYIAIGEAGALAQAMRNDKELTMRTFLGLKRKEYKPLSGPFGQTLLLCDYQGEKLEVFYSYKYGYWTEKKLIVIPDAYEVKNCKDATVEELIKLGKAKKAE